MAQRRGLFGGFNPIRFNERPNDKMMMLGAALSSMGSGGDPSAMLGVGQMIRGRQAEEQKQQANRMIGGLFGGQQPAPAFDIDALAHGSLGPTDAERTQQPAGLPTMAQAAPTLWQASQMGGDIGAAISMIDKSKPNLQVGPDGTTFDANNPNNDGRRFANRTNINGFVTDMNNPKSEGRYLPQLGEGQTPLYDAQGNVVAVRNLDGAVQALAQREGAVAAAKAASTNPYELETVMGPNGQPITASRQALLGDGPIYGQSDAERAYAVDSAKNDADRENNAPQAAGRIAAANQSAQALTGAIGTALDQISGLSTGLVGMATGGIPGTPAKDLRATINTIKANVGFDYLQQMRELSPTGGALGQVAVQEMEALQAVLGNLDPSQSPEQLATNLRQIGRLVQQGQDLRQRAYEQQYGQAPARAPSSQSPRRVSSQAEFQSLPSGSVFIAPDGTTRRKP